MDDTPLGKLPVEIRLIIYELTLVDANSVSIERCLFESPRWEPKPATLQVCRQMRSEARAIYYGCNTFYFWCASGGLTEQLDSWLHGLDAEDQAHGRRVVLVDAGYNPSLTLAQLRLEDTELRMRERGFTFGERDDGYDRSTHIFVRCVGDPAA